MRGGGRGRGGRSNTLNTTPNAWRTIRKGTNSSSSNAFKALANEDFFWEIALVAASNTHATTSSKKVESNTQATSSSENTISEIVQQE